MAVTNQHLQEQINDVYDMLITLEDKLDAVYKLLNKGDMKQEPRLASFRKIFETYYQQQYSDAYYWEAKDWVAIKKIVKKIAFKMKAKNKVEPTEEQVLKAFQIFLDHIDDNWVLANMSLSLLSQKFNELVNKMNKHGGIVRQAQRVGRRIDEEGS